jgi:hypothetical protein
MLVPADAEVDDRALCRVLGALKVR